MCQVLTSPCLHCREAGGLRWRRRHLCWRCYRSRRIRSQYRGVLCGLGAAHLDFGGNPDPPEQATEAPPGSPGKIRDMRGRAELGQALHHPDDAGARSTDEMRREAERTAAAFARLAQRLRTAQKAAG
jgi:hypothetical protein